MVELPESGAESKLRGNLEGEPHAPCPVCQAGLVAFYRVD